MPKTTEVLIGKLHILATYTYAKALLEGDSEPDAKEGRIIAAIMGAKVKAGHVVDHKAQKSSAEEKKEVDDHRRAVRPPSFRQDGRVLRRSLPAFE